MDDALPPEEAELLHRFAPTGLDWRTSVRDLAARLGVTRPYDWQDMVALPLVPTLAELPIAWTVVVLPATIDRVPTWTSAWWMPEARAEENLASAITALTPCLGAPTPTQTSNTRGAVWKRGIFTVRATIWPAHQRDPRTVNPLLARVPRLADAATLEVETPLAPIEPDHSLLPVVGRVAGGEGAWLAPSLTVEAGGRLARRNPAVLRAALEGRGAFVWADEARVGLSTPFSSHVSGRGEARLSLTRMLPARGPGGALFHMNGQVVMRADTTDGLRAATDAVARTWKLPVMVDDVDDD